MVEHNPRFDEYIRLETFPLHWGHQFDKSILSRNGFYYTEPRVQCVFCDLVIDPREDHGDLLENLHRRLAPSCNLAHGRPTSNRPLEPITNFRLERHRLVSFLVRDWNAPVDPHDLAKWGFYSTGTADVGRCFSCRLEVRGWEPGDTGEGEHRRWNINCPFLRGRSTGNVPLGEEGEILRDSAPQQSSPVHAQIHVTPGSEHLSVGDLGVTLNSTPRHPKYVTRSERLNSFQNFWPVSLSQHPEQLSEAGFYYTGRGDRVVCFHCGGGLKDWGHGDLPWNEHAVWFPTCPFLLLSRGAEFVRTVQQARNRQIHGDEASNATQAVTGSETEISLNTVEITSDNDDGARGGSEGRQCVLCHQQDIGIVFLPCGHMTTCPTCATDRTACPTCKNPVRAYVRAYLP